MLSRRRLLSGTQASHWRRGLGPRVLDDRQAGAHAIGAVASLQWWSQGRIPCFRRRNHAQDDRRVELSAYAICANASALQNYSVTYAIERVIHVIRKGHSSGVPIWAASPRHWCEHLLAGRDPAQRRSGDPGCATFPPRGHCACPGARGRGRLLGLVVGEGLGNMRYSTERVHHSAVRRIDAARTLSCDRDDRLPQRKVPAELWGSPQQRCPCERLTARDLPNRRLPRITGPGGRELPHECELGLHGCKRSLRLVRGSCGRLRR